MPNWTEDNKSEPQGAWGQAAVSESGFSAGAENNTVGWGWAHPRSWGHAITNLFGKLSALTDGFDLFLPSNDTEPLNTANELIGTSGGGSFLEFNDLTGVTITATVGTGALTIVGNDMDFTTSGNIRKIYVDNNGVAEELLLTEGVGNIKTSTGTLTGTLNGITWGNGVDTAISEGTQTALMSFNNYDYQNGIDTAVYLASNTLTDFDIDIDMYYVNTGKEQVLLSHNLNMILIMLRRTLSGNKLVFYYNNVLIYVYPTILTTGKYNFKYSLLGTTLSITVNNGVQTNITVAPASITGLTTFGAFQNGNVYQVIGVLFRVIINGVEYTTFNNWGGIGMFGTISKYVAPENPLDLGNDYFGETIQRPKLTDGYNFSGQVEYLSTSILDRDGANTDMCWLRLKSLDDQLIAGDDVYSLKLVSGKFTVTFNGVTLTSTLTPLLNKAYFIYSVIDYSGICSLYIGDILTAPSLDKSLQLGVPIAATTPMLYGNTTTSTSSFNGYITQLGHWALENDITEATNDYNATKSKAP